MFYVTIIDNKINGKGECPCSGEGISCIEIEQEVYDNLERYMYSNGEIVKNPDYDSEILTKAKEEKYKQALQGAKDYINNGAYYRYDENNTIEATDGNIGKLTAYALSLQAGLFESVTWTSKEDNVLTLTAEDVTKILTGVGAVQADIWNVQYIAFKEATEAAGSLEELNNIAIEYTSDVPKEENNEDTTDTDTVSDEMEAADSEAGEQSTEANGDTSGQSEDVEDTGSK